MTEKSRMEIKVLVIGAGQRGQAYTQFLPSIKDIDARVVAIAEPNRLRASLFAKRHHVPLSNIHASHFEVANLGPRAYGADAVFICTQDALHLECIQLFSALEYHILCEKPLATTLADCQHIRDLLVNAKTPRLFGIGHVLRYSPYNMLLKQFITDKVIGDIVTINHTEPVGHAHFAHSYVRGNWRRQDSSACVLLTKSCHDIDLIQWLLQSSFDGRVVPCRVQSIGSLSHFRKSQKPRRAAQALHCLNCALVDSCPYSAKLIYVDNFLANGELRGFQKTLTDVEDLDSIHAALMETNYGKCVYEMDNDVCDNQIVNLQYHARHGPINVSFTMVAFSRDICVRKTTIYGTHGQIQALGNNQISVYDFATETETVYHTEEFKGSRESNSHGGGDFGLVSQFIHAINAVKNGTNVALAQRDFIGSTIEEIFTSHAIVFAADRARQTAETIKTI